MPKPVTIKKFKCEPVKISTVSDLVFASTLNRRGYWEEQINLLRGNPDTMLRIMADDASSLTQIRTRAKRSGLALLFARKDEFVFVRAWLPSEDQTRLVLLLREERTVNDLRGKGLTMNVEAELQALAAHGHAEFKGGKWRLTNKGKTELLKSAA